jgi:c-di-GMP-related signal transduction protein
MNFSLDPADMVNDMTASANASPALESGPCLARQPILTADEKVLGYELLFRENPEENRFTPDGDGESATSSTIDTLNVLGLDVVCDGRLAFINCTHQMLLKGYVALLPSDQVVVEILESVPADEGTLTACRGLKQAGFLIALDNFAPGDAREALVPYAGFIKVDIRKIAPRESAALAARYGRQCRMLALKVQTREDFLAAREGGFTLFQGYFFRRPERMRARKIPANQATYLRVLQAISRKELDFTEIEDLVKHEAALCYRLLRYLNSPLLGLSSPVQSVRHALNLLGERELVRWLRMATTLVMGQDKCSDLVLSSLVRARFCELLAPKIEHGQSDLFLMGMLSLMDAILEVPMGVVLEGIALDPDTKAELLRTKTGSETPLSAICALMVARELGDWEGVTAQGKKLNLSLPCMNRAYNEALTWARQVAAAAPKPS